MPNGIAMTADGSALLVCSTATSVRANTLSPTPQYTTPSSSPLRLPFTSPFDTPFDTPFTPSPPLPPAVPPYPHQSLYKIDLDSKGYATSDGARVVQNDLQGGPDNIRRRHGKVRFWSLRALKSKTLIWNPSHQAGTIFNFFFFFTHKINHLFLK